MEHSRILSAMSRFPLIALALAGLLTVLPVGASAQADERPVDFWLTLLHSNDGESQLIDAGSGLEDFGGVARFAARMNKLREKARPHPRGAREGERPESPPVLIVSSGDNYLAGPEFNASLEHGVPFFDTIGFDYLKYDAMAIGNHEFDFGPDVFADFIHGFLLVLHQDLTQYTPPRFVSANLDFSAEPRLQEMVDGGFIQKSIVAEPAGERGGIVGATTPMLPHISSPRFVVVDPDVVGAIQAEIDALLADGVDKIILISHL